jgi:spore coat polysaccharide biosynthesis predicted glycosyltransferase SpsG
MNPDSIRLAFDLSPETGLGHFHRCLCLAKDLESKNYETELYAIGEGNDDLLAREQRLHRRKISHIRDMPLTGPLIIVDSYLAKSSPEFAEQVSNYLRKAYVADSRDFPKWADRIVYPHLGRPNRTVSNWGAVILEGREQFIFDPELCLEQPTKHTDSCVVILSGTETKFYEVERFLSKFAEKQNIEINFCNPSTPRVAVIELIRRSELAIVSAGIALIETIAGSCKPLPIKYAENQAPNLNMIQSTNPGFTYLERQEIFSVESQEIIQRFFNHVMNQDVSSQQLGLGNQGASKSAGFFTDEKLMTSA